jgi:hypothetical protein
MQLNPVFDRCFRKLYGKPCWNVKHGHGSFLTLEFGEPLLSIYEPHEPDPKDDVTEKVRQFLARRTVIVHGQWHLWIYCCDWKVSNGRTIVSSSSSNQAISDAVAFLDGQVLVNTSFHYRGCRSVFDFDLGAQLETMPYDSKSEQWYLYEPTGKILTLCADKLYCHQNSNIKPDNEKWFPAWEKK